MDQTTILLFSIFSVLLTLTIFGICKHLIDTKSITSSRIVISSFFTGFLGGITLLRVGVQLQIHEGKMEHANLWFGGTLLLTLLALGCLIYGLVYFALDTIRQRK